MYEKKLHIFAVLVQLVFSWSCHLRSHAIDSSIMCWIAEFCWLLLRIQTNGSHHLALENLHLLSLERQGIGKENPQFPLDFHGLAELDLQLCSMNNQSSGMLAKAAVLPNLTYAYRNLEPSKFPRNFAKLCNGHVHLEGTWDNPYGLKIHAKFMRQRWTRFILRTEQLNNTLSTNFCIFFHMQLRTLLNISLIKCKSLNIPMALYWVKVWWSYRNSDYSHRCQFHVVHESLTRLVH